MAETRREGRRKMSEETGRNGESQGDGAAPGTGNSVVPRRLRPSPRTDAPYVPRYDFSGLGELSADEAALAYLEKGWRLVPVKPKTGELLGSRGIDAATSGHRRVCHWLDQGAEVGVSTGRRSGVVALVLDAMRGKRTWSAMSQGKPPLATLEGNSAALRGGNLVLFRAPSVDLPSRADIAPGVAFLGEGEYFHPKQSAWSREPVVLAEVPEWLMPLLAGEATFGLRELVAAGDFTAANGMSREEAANAYRRLRWRLIPFSAEGFSDPSQVQANKSYLPSFWQRNPHLGIAVIAGLDSGVVGLHGRGSDLKALADWHGMGLYPRISGRGFDILVFRAPQERFPGRELPRGVTYLGEGDCFELPPYQDGAERFNWEYQPPGLPGPPELPEWLRELLSAPEVPVTVPPTTPAHAGQKGKPSEALASELLKAAFDYAKKGWLVFPVKEGDKKPPITGWQTKATREKRQLAKWWARSNRNIALKTGRDSGIVVLDADPPKEGSSESGLQNLADLEACHGRISTLRATTTSGGQHLFFRAPKERLGNRAGILTGIDFRGDGGFVVLAPSRTPAGAYRWQNPGTRIAEMPEWLLELVTTKKTKGKKGTRAPRERVTFREAFAGIPDGQRTDTIFRFAWHLRQEGWDYDEAKSLVLLAAERCLPPFSEDEAVPCLDGAWKYAPTAALTDLGNAERFLAIFGANLRYVEETGRWLAWKGNFWETSSRAAARSAKAAVRSIRDEAMAAEDPAVRKRLLSHGRKSESVEAMESMMELVSQMLAVREQDLNRPGLLAFTNGVLDLGTREFRPGRREDLLTKYLPREYDPEDPACASQVETKRLKAAGGRTGRETPQWWEEQFDRWVSERCEQGPEYTEKSETMCKNFFEWAHYKISPKRLSRLLAGKGFQHRKDKNSLAIYVGLRLRP
ncbi:hypothetical protein GMSM_42640 [Geomonas sp. Red276]